MQQGNGYSNLSPLDETFFFLSRGAHPSEARMKAGRMVCQPQIILLSLDSRLLYMCYFISDHDSDVNQIFSELDFLQILNFYSTSSLSLLYCALCLILIIAYTGPLFVMQGAERIRVEVKG